MVDQVQQRKHRQYRDIIGQRTAPLSAGGDVQPAKARQQRRDESFSPQEHSDVGIGMSPVKFPDPIGGKVDGIRLQIRGTFAIVAGQQPAKAGHSLLYRFMFLEPPCPLTPGFGEE